MESIIYYLAVMVIAAIAVRALQPTPETPKAAQLGDFDVPTAEEGRPIPVIFGTCWMKSPNVIWYGDLKTTPIKKKGGGK